MGMFRLSGRNAPAAVNAVYSPPESEFPATSGCELNCKSTCGGDDLPEIDVCHRTETYDPDFCVGPRFLVRKSVDSLGGYVVT